MTQPAPRSTAVLDGFFGATLAESDPDVFAAVQNELQRQRHKIELIASENIVRNARALAETLKSEGLDIVSGGTDNHLMLVDLRPKKATGKLAEKALDRASITCNKNAIPYDPEKPFVTSGIRLGTPAGTTRGFGVAEFQEIGRLIVEVIDSVSGKNSEEGDSAVEAAVARKVMALCERFPIY